MQTDHAIIRPLLQQLLIHKPMGISKPGNTINLNELYDDIRLHLENLLNARTHGFNLRDTLPELRQSILNYGMLDFSQYDFSSKTGQSDLCQHIQEVINNFEPRLKNVRVSIQDEGSNHDRTLKIRIMAEIHLRITAQAAIFESDIDISKQVFTFI